jgi:hypothetical protein
MPTTARKTVVARKTSTPPAGKAVKPAKAVAASKGERRSAAAPAAAAKPKKQRIKLVRDGFTMPQPDFDLIDMLKARTLEAKRATKKSELLRAGLHALAGLPPERLIALLGGLTAVKTGRPKKTH